MTSFADLVQDPGERNLVYGGTRTGKSSYCDWCMRHIQRTRPDCMMLVADTKPRFRAETVAYGPNNRWRKNAIEAKTYEHWASGPIVPNSVRVNMESEHPFRGLWKEPGEIAIMQGGDKASWKMQNLLMKAFVDRQIKGRERLVVVDEGMDFYERNTQGIMFGEDTILHAARAGGERNVGLLFNAHRPRGIPPLLNTLSSRVTLFHVRFAADMKYLYDMGIPQSEESPNGNYIFNQYHIEPGGVVSQPLTCRLALPESYLAQLAAT